MRTMLYCEANKGRTVKTSFGAITFDAKGFAEADLASEHIQLCRNLKWLVTDAESKEDMLLRMKEQYATQEKGLKDLAKQIEDLEHDIKTSKAPKPLKVKSDEDLKKEKEDAAISDEMKKLEAQGQAAGAREDAASVPVTAAGTKKHK